MALTFSECLREARSIPCFSGSCDYNLTNYLKDVETTLSLADPQYHLVLKRILLNNLRGKALACMETLVDCSFDNCIRKLREEFGEKKSYLSLRGDASDIVAHDIKDLYEKLKDILKRMNSKFFTEGAIEELYNPGNNDRIIFDVFITFLPCHIKTLLLQNGIWTLNNAYSYFLTNDLLDDIRIKNQYKKSGADKQATTNYKKKNNNNTASSSRFDQNYEQDHNRVVGNKYYSNMNAPKNMQGNSGNFHNRNNNMHSGQYRQSGNFRNPFRAQNQEPIEPMEVGNIERYENFRLSPDRPTYP